MKWQHLPTFCSIVKDFLAEEFGNNRIWSLDFPIAYPLEVLKYILITHMGPRTNDVFAFAAIAWEQLAPQTI